MFVSRWCYKFGSLKAIGQFSQTNLISRWNFVKRTKKNFNGVLALPGGYTSRIPKHLWLQITRLFELNNELYSKRESHSPFCSKCLWAICMIPTYVSPLKCKTDLFPEEPRSTICIQRFHDSLSSAIHTTKTAGGVLHRCINQKIHR